MTFLFFVGTRPEAIKIAPLYLTFKKSFPEHKTKLCLTGQHSEMLLQVMEIFDLKADFNLEVMTQGQDLYSLSAKLLLGIKNVIEDVKPDFIFVHGDTTTSFIAALAGFYRKIKICHIEAGLRTGNLYSPFPEEANRSLTARITNFHFAPSQIAKKNLISEGINEDSIVVTGNTVVDSLILIQEKISNRDNSDLFEKFSKIDLTKKIILVTNHRRENLEHGIREVFNAIYELSVLYPDIEFVFPVHLNPIITAQAHEVLQGLNNVHLLSPLNYIEFSFFMNKSYLIITDSGGIQEEAPILGKPVIVTRLETERPEAVESGISFLLGPDRRKIIDKVEDLLQDDDYYRSIAKPNFVYGDGKSCQRIADHFKKSIL